MEETIREINRYLALKNMRQVELARKLGTSPASVSNWLNGKNKISKVYLKLIKETLGIK